MFTKQSNISECNIKMHDVPRIGSYNFRNKDNPVFTLYDKSRVCLTKNHVFTVQDH